MAFKRSAVRSRLSPPTKRTPLRCPFFVGAKRDRSGALRKQSGGLFLEVRVSVCERRRGRMQREKSSVPWSKFAERERESKFRVPQTESAALTGCTETHRREETAALHQNSLSPPPVRQVLFFCPLNLSEYFLFALKPFRLCDILSL